MVRLRCGIVSNYSSCSENGQKHTFMYKNGLELEKRGMFYGFDRNTDESIKLIFVYLQMFLCLCLSSSKTEPPTFLAPQS